MFLKTDCKDMVLFFKNPDLSGKNSYSVKVQI